MTSSYNNWCYGYTMSSTPAQTASTPGSALPDNPNYGYGTYDPPRGPTTQYQAQHQAPNQTASSRLHNFALQHNIWESYSSAGHASGFVVTLSLGNEKFIGNGSSLRDAKEDAAAKGLRHVTPGESSYVRSSVPYSYQPSPRNPVVNPGGSSGTTTTSTLHELATKKGVKVEFKFTEPYNFKFKSSMRTWAKADILSTYKVHLKVASYDFYGQADHPQKAKHNAASEALPYVEALPDIPKAKSTVSDGMLEGKNVIMALNEISMTNGLCPEWNMVGDQGLPHQRTFTWSLKLGEYEAVGTGSSKKVAKTNAAQQMLSTIPEEWKKAVLEETGKKKKKSKKRKSKSVQEEASIAAPAVNAEIGPTMPKQMKLAEESATDNGEPSEVTNNGGTKSNGQLDNSLPVYEQVTSSNPISCLYEFCKKAKISDPLFECVDENVIDTWQKGNQTLKKTEYTMKLILKDKTYYDSGPNKKTAKNNVATKAWNNIRAGIDLNP